MIGKNGRDISEENALDYVLGYTASNDVSARTLQLVTAQWSMSKGLDSSCPIGQLYHSRMQKSDLADGITRPSSSFAINNPGSSDFEHQGDL